MEPGARLWGRAGSICREGGETAHKQARAHNRRDIPPLSGSPCRRPAASFSAARAARAKYSHLISFAYQVGPGRARRVALSLVEELPSARLFDRQPPPGYVVASGPRQLGRAARAKMTVRVLTGASPWSSSPRSLDFPPVRVVMFQRTRGRYRVRGDLSRLSADFVATGPFAVVVVCWSGDSLQCLSQRARGVGEYGGGVGGS